jgi:extracellular elastinolytic metalloproteinase
LATDRQAKAKWNRFGTPRSLIRVDGYLARGLPGNPVTAARRWIAENRVLLGLSETETSDLELVSAAPVGAGRAVLLRQRFDGLAAGHDGLIVVGVVEGSVAYVSSSLARETALTGEPRLSAAEALQAAAAEAGMELGTLSQERAVNGWTVFDPSSLTHPARARLVAVPTPTSGVRPAWETSLIDNDASPAAFASFVDAETGSVLIRESAIDHLADNPTWKVFPNTPPMDYSSTDTRDWWCWLPGAPQCELVLQNSASRFPWDFSSRLGMVTNTTHGNAAKSVENWNNNNPFSVGVTPATARAERDYVYD